MFKFRIVENGYLPGQYLLQVLHRGDWVHVTHGGYEDLLQEAWGLQGEYRGRF